MAVYTIGPSKTERHSHTWHRVTRKEPCPICSDIDWCEVCLDGCVHCMRTESSIRSDSRMGGYIHNLPDWRSTPPPINRPAKPKPETPTALASLDDRHRVYSDLLNACQIGAVHEAWLLGQGIDQPAGSYATLNGNRAEVCRHLMRTYPQELLITVPGLWIHDDGTLGIAAMDGLLVAVRGIDGRIERLQCRVEQNGKKAYHWLSSSSHGGPSSGAIPHYADGPDKRRVYITEGVKKAEICALLTGHPCIGMAGHSGYMAALEMVKRLDIDSVVAALDEDADPKTAGLVDRSRDELVQQALQRGLAVRVARWPHEQGKGIDDLLLAGYQPTITKISDLLLKPVVDSTTDDDLTVEYPAVPESFAKRFYHDVKALWYAKGGMSALDRWTQVGIWIQQKRLPDTSNDPDPICLETLATRLNVSTETVGNTLDALDQYGLCKRTKRTNPATHYPQVLVATLRVPAYGEEITPAIHRAKDAARKRCKACGSDDLIDKRICKTCGYVQSVKRVNFRLESVVDSTTNAPPADDLLLTPEKIDLTNNKDMKGEDACILTHQASPDGSEPTSALKTLANALFTPSPSTGVVDSSAAMMPLATAMFGSTPGLDSGGGSCPLSAVEGSVSPGNNLSIERRTAPPSLKDMQKPTLMPEEQSSTRSISLTQPCNANRPLRGCSTCGRFMWSSHGRDWWYCGNCGADA